MQFHQLKVTNLEKTIRDAVVLTLEPDNKDAFEFTQGQYLTFKRDFDGEELRRSYSICSSKQGGLLQVGIKRVDGGAFSSWANSELQIGDTLEAMPPMGNFYKPKEVSSGAHYLAFAGGSGITPILSILRTGLRQEPTAKFTLVYANRNTNSIMFREELEDLKNTNLDRLSIIHVLEEDSQGIELFHGRVDADKCERLFSGLIDLESVTTAYICGPEPMMLAISDALETHGLAKEDIRFELFASGQPGRAKKKALSSKDDKKGIPGKVTIGGVTQTLLFDRDTSLLEAAAENNLDPPFACKAGVCSTCKAKVTEGEVEMIANHALEDYEVEAGFVLTCQCYAVSDTIAWDYDEAGH
ncbi:MAG: 2Fe-2S iron-sulfur cluster-binding protein [Rhizobiaceae bacterium]|nr:2Fe-2S iron-sulfur cluster-binding protein [Rhizobiaceae bacterium]